MDMPSASPNGGFKFYFGDVGSGGGGGFPVNSGRGSSSAGGITAKKGRGGGGVVQGGAQPPRCQVEGCNVDLSDAKSYYSRHKVCGNHSKSPKVIVSGIEQRFCQQCSRFHLLPEFDQEKRSCRRRLAGHNERRRKPPPASLLSTQYGNSSIFGNGCGGGSFLMDFSTYPRPMAESGSQPSGLKFLPNPWQSNSESPSPELQSSANKTTYPGPVIPSGGCFAGGSDSSSCALSLLSNQPCVSRNQSSSLGVNYLLDTYGSHMVQPAVSHNISHFSSNTWSLKDDEAGTIPFDMYPELGLGQISQPGTSRYTSDPQPTLQSGKQQYMDLEHSMEYDSSAQHMRWSL